VWNELYEIALRLDISIHIGVYSQYTLLAPLACIQWPVLQHLEASALHSAIVTQKKDKLFPLTFSLVIYAYTYIHVLSNFCCSFRMYAFYSLRLIITRNHNIDDYIVMCYFLDMGFGLVTGFIVLLQIANILVLIKILLNLNTLKFTMTRTKSSHSAVCSPVVASQRIPMP
jgi:hypothetical protein